MSRNGKNSCQEPSIHPSDCFRSTASRSRMRSATHKWMVTKADTCFSKAQDVRKTLNTPEKVRRYLESMRRLFLDRLGSMPECGSTPKSRVVSRLKFPTHRLEKIVFESRPGLLVTANLYLPLDLAVPAPACLVPAGHIDDGKGYPEYQKVCMALAKAGFVAMSFDPIGQGERIQFPDRRRFKSRLIHCVNEHATLSWRSELLGFSIGGFMIHDGRRALDYLAGRPEVDSSRLAITGSSGGGTQSSFIGAIDRRLRAVVPNCYLCDRRSLIAQERILFDPEQVQDGLIRDGLDHAELIGMAAPAAVLVQAGLKDDGFDYRATSKSVADARKWFKILEIPGSLAIQLENVGHGYAKPFREGTVNWLTRHMLGEKIQFKEPLLRTGDRRSVWCSTTGNVLDIGSKTVLDLLRVQARQASSRRRRTKITSQRLGKILGLTPESLRFEGKGRASGKAIWNGMLAERFLIEGEDSFPIPSVLIRPRSGKPTAAVIVASERSKSWELENNQLIHRWVSNGVAVVLADLRGLGELRQVKKMWPTPTDHWCHTIGHEGFLQQWMLQLGDSLMACRTRDLAAVSAFSERKLNLPSQKIHCFARGVNAWSAAVLALLRPSGQLAVSDFMASFDEVFESDIPSLPPSYVVHGAMNVFDLPELLRALGGRLSWAKRPLDAQGKALPPPQLKRYLTAIGLPEGGRLESFMRP